MHTVQLLTVCLMQFQNWDNYADIHNGSFLSNKVGVGVVTSKQASSHWDKCIMGQLLMIYRKSLLIFVIALWWVIEHSENRYRTRELQTMYLESSIDLLSDNRKVTQLMFEEWKNFVKVKQTLYIMDGVYKKIDLSMHRKTQGTHV